MLPFKLLIHFLNLLIFISCIDQKISAQFFIKPKIGYSYLSIKDKNGSNDTYLYDEKNLSLGAYNFGISFNHKISTQGEIGISFNFAREYAKAKSLGFISIEGVKFDNYSIGPIIEYNIFNRLTTGFGLNYSFQNNLFDKLNNKDKIEIIGFQSQAQLGFTFFCNYSINNILVGLGISKYIINFASVENLHSFQPHLSLFFNLGYKIKLN